MSGFIRATELDIGTHFFRTGSWAKPSALWVGLFTTMPANDGTGGVEVTGGAYGRVQRNPGDANWAIAGSTFYNTADIVFPMPTADWGLIVGAGLWSLSSGGVLYIVGELVTVFQPLGGITNAFPGVTILAGDAAAKFDAGQLRFEIL